jgi:hypothetical protein
MKEKNWKGVIEMGTLPVWYTRWMTDIDAQVGFDYHCVDGNSGKIAYINAMMSFRPVEDRHIPEFLFMDRDKDIRPSLRDAFRIVGKVLVCSKAFRDVLIEHDLGSTRLYEVPVYADEAKTPSDIPSHYLLHVTEAKSNTFAPEHSKGVEQVQSLLEATPRPNAPWTHIYDRDVLAVKESSAQGVDLWCDPQIRRRIFLSDRLKKAIEAAGITSRALSLQKAKIVPE